MRRTLAVAAVSGAMVIGLASSALAAGPGTYNGTAMSRPTSATPKYGYISGSGCGATTTAKVDRAQTIFADTSADAHLFCDYVRVRVFYYSGSSSYYSAWDKDYDSAQVVSSSYTTAFYQMTVSSLD